MEILVCTTRFKTYGQKINDVNQWKFIEKKGKNTNNAKTERRKRRYSISRTRFTSVRMNFKGYFRSICIVTQCTLSLWILCSGNVIPLLIIKGRFTATFFL